MKGLYKIALVGTKVLKSSIGSALRLCLLQPYAQVLHRSIFVISWI